MDVLNQQVTSHELEEMGIVGRAMSAREVKLRIDALRFRNLACSTSLSDGHAPRRSTTILVSYLS